jgi:hypothetical protein
MDFKPVGATTEEPTPRDDLTIVDDEFGVPHITGETREAVAYGAGWVTARDRGLLIELGRGPARAAVADVPGINAFSLVTSGQSFVPSEATEQLVSDQVRLLIDTYGAEGEEIVADAQAYADGMNAYVEANGIDQVPATVNDVVAVTAFIGSIFGAGGGGEAANAEFLAALQGRLGDEQGRLVWDDLLRTGRPGGTHHDRRALRVPGAHGRGRDRVGGARRGLGDRARSARAGAGIGADHRGGAVRRHRRA